MRPVRGLSAPLELRLQARPEYAPLLRERLRMWLEEAGANKREVFEVVLATTSFHLLHVRSAA
jgi:hypothetical protein